MVQGSRYVPGGGVRRRRVVRRLFSRAANLLYNWGAGAPHECTTNFRVLSHRAAMVILARAGGNGYEFMPEATLLVLAAGLKVQEVPITFTGRERGQSKMGRKQVLDGITGCLSNVVQYRLRMGRFSRRHAADTQAIE